MKVHVRLLATYREYLPPECEGSTYEIEAPAGAAAVSVLNQFGVPTTGNMSVILVNGAAPAPDQLLKEGDVVCAFPAIAGG